MTDFNEKLGATDEGDMEFEGHRLAGPEKIGKLGDISDDKLGATDEDDADFEGHRFGGPQKIAKLGDVTDVKG